MLLVMACGSVTDDGDGPADAPGLGDEGSTGDDGVAEEPDPPDPGTTGAEGSTGMRPQWGVGQVGAGGLHLAVGRTPQAYMRPADAGTADYRELEEKQRLAQVDYPSIVIRLVGQ